MRRSLTLDFRLDSTRLVSSRLVSISQECYVQIFERDDSDRTYPKFLECACVADDAVNLFLKINTTQISVSSI